jgi:ankyrin repeat protein
VAEFGLSMAPTRQGRLRKLLQALTLAAGAGIALGALDAVHGPREHPVEGQITALQRQLFDAVLEGDSKLLNITNLITAGADPNGYNEQHLTALHLATIKGQRLAVGVLLSRGAHTDVRDMAYRTPMHYCAAYGRGDEFPSVLTELYLAGANLNAGDQAHNTPLHLAAYEGYTATALQLVHYGARTDAVNLWQQV